ncbi:MAG: bifunctional folylpolyglutamate synthase/dihydrofolate synthase [Bacillus sp. (in: Bacteria)]|nr:bifunctional folylpolyglutamate synthase/dihydrofolate synthase [Bacillus sp. (in: firmicutes)]
MFTYSQAMEFVKERQKAGIRYDLRRITRLMEEIRHPERKVKTIHVAGTNGKGSTVTFLRSILQETGLFVGTYMTPVVGDYRLQMAVNETPMTEQEFTIVLEEIAPKVLEVEQEMGELISEFELITAMALYFFSFKKPVDIAVIETGMGGRNDATNIIRPLVSVITNVGMDHQAFLGDTLEKIASEKAGIIKGGLPVMTACDEAEFPVFQQEAKDKKASLYRLQEHVRFETYMEEGVQKLSYETPYRHVSNAKLGMTGNHQGKNAALAIMTVDYLKQFYAVMVDDEHIIKGLEKAKLPGRCEVVHQQPDIIIDTAHNPEAMAVTIETVKEMYGDQELHVLFAAMKDKDVEAMVSQLQGVTKHLSVTTFSSERAVSLAEWARMAGVTTIPDPYNWLKAWKETHKEEVLLITGSNQFVGEIKRSLFENIKDRPFDQL